MRSPRLAAAGLCSIALAAACSGSKVEQGGARKPLSSSSHLLDRLEEATWHGDLRGLGGDLAAPDADELVLCCEFDELPAAPWFDGAWQQELAADLKAPRHARASLEASDGGRAIELDSADDGLHLLLPAPEGESYLVAARVRVPEGGAGGELRLLPHRFAAPTIDELPAVLRSIDASALQSALESGAKAEVGGPDAASWRDLSLFVGPEAGRACLSLSLIPSTRGLVVDRVTVRRLPVAASLHLARRLPFDGASCPQRRLLLLGSGSVDALLVPSGARVRWRLDVPRQSPRLLVVPGALAVRAGERALLVVRVDGEELLRQRCASCRSWEKPSLAAVEIDLARFAGKTASLELSVESEADVVGFFGAPELLGADERPPARSLVLISLDTLRADHLGCYGDGRRLSSAIDKLAAEGVRFETVWSPSSYTLPTHLSLLCGQHPLVHGEFGPTQTMDSLRTLLLSTRLRELGASTAAFTGGGLIEPRLGFGAGFDVYGVDDPCGATHLRRERHDSEEARASRGEDHVAPVISWLRAHRDQPFFLFVHTYFVHNYAPHRRFLARVADPDARIDDDAPIALRERAKKGDGAALDRLRGLYAATVAEVDETLVQRLLAALDELGLSDRTIVSVVSDHGEELLEHGGAGHAKELFGECTRVPWILRGPGVPAGVVRDDPVELADAAATLAKLLGLPSDPRVQARDQLAAAPEENRAAGRLLVLGETGHGPRREALVVGPWKLMKWSRPNEAPQLRLFKIDEDPREQRDVAFDDPSRLRALAAALAARRGELEELAASLPRSAPESARLTPEQEAELRALGYLDDELR